MLLQKAAARPDNSAMSSSWGVIRIFKNAKII